MKHLLLIGDGMADLPCPALSGQTPLQAARMPQADRMARDGRLGSARFIPEGMEPGSELGLLSILGYDVRQGVPGRAALEAAGRGVHLGPGETVFRVNFATVSEGRLLDSSAGGVRSEEARALCETLNDQLGESAVRFVPGVGYRALMIAAFDVAGVRCAHPQKVLDQPLESHWPQGTGAEALQAVMRKAQSVLDAHEVNVVRRDLGENPANALWLWGPGSNASLQPFAERTQLKAALAAGVDVAKGIARLAGMTVLEVPGATGGSDSDFGAKAQAAVASLASHDMGIVHVEAPDEASHAGDPRAKVSLLERFDSEVIGPALAAAGAGGLRVALATDHITSSDQRAHLPGAVPVALWGPGFSPRREGLAYDEGHAAESDLKFEAGHEFMEYFLAHR